VQDFAGLSIIRNATRHLVSALAQHPSQRAHHVTQSARLGVRRHLTGRKQNFHIDVATTLTDRRFSTQPCSGSVVACAVPSASGFVACGASPQGGWSFPCRIFAWGHATLHGIPVVACPPQCCSVRCPQRIRVVACPPPSAFGLYRAKLSQTRRAESLPTAQSLAQGSFSVTDFRVGTRDATPAGPANSTLPSPPLHRPTYRPCHRVPLQI